MRDWLCKLLFGETRVEMDKRLQAKSLMLDSHHETLKMAHAFQQETGKALAVRGAQLDALHGLLATWYGQLQTAARSMGLLDAQPPTDKPTLQ